MGRSRSIPIVQHTARVLCTLCFLCALPMVALSQPSHPAPAQAPPASAPEIITPDTSTLPKGTVTRVLDTDTLMLKVDGRTLRIDLLGVSAATAGNKANDPDTAEAVAFLDHLLLGETVAIQYDPLGELTAANKRAAYIFRLPDNQFVNLELIRQGYARHTDSSMSIHLEAFAYYQQRAQDLKHGIWDPDRAHPVLVADPVPDAQPAPLTTTTTTRTTGDDIVYITKYGKSYHRKDCPHLTDTQRQVHRRDIKDNYKPCKTCKPDG